MNQIPIAPVAYPNAVQQQQPYMPIPQQPNYNAVKIDIQNPSVNTQGVGQYNPQYAQPTMPYYNYPQQQIYTYPQAQQTPCYPCSVPQQAPAIPQAPVAPQPVTVEQNPAVNQQNINVPVPQPVDIKTEPPVVPAPVVTNPQAPSVAPATKPEVVPSAPVTPQVDINAFISKLANPDFETQAAGMEEIANMVKTTPDKATELVDTKVFDALNNIVTFDSSKLEGPTQEQLAAREKMMSGKEVNEQEKALANKITPKEQAERNKSYALFTTAIMEKLYADEVARLSNNSVPLTELPGAISIVDQLKDNPNPMVRASAIEALSYIQNPAYKKDLTTLFTVAKNDQDAGVVEAAKTALDKINQA